LKPGNSRVAERAEIFIGGLELLTATVELHDASEQRARFVDEAGRIEKEQCRPAPLPEKFLDAVGRMPDCTGMALGWTGW
jgi:lysyl-tRNA synthetase class 2